MLIHPDIIGRKVKNVYDNKKVGQVIGFNPDRGDDDNFLVAIESGEVEYWQVREVIFVNKKFSFLKNSLKSINLNRADLLDLED